MNAALTFLALSGTPPPDPLWRELAHLPPHCVAVRNLACAKAHYTYLHHMRGLIPPYHYLSTELDLWLEEADFCCQCWRCLEYATDRDLVILFREEELAAFKDLVGPDRFRRGWTPPAIPPHHCQRAD